MAKQKETAGRDVQQVKVIKSKDGKVLVDEEEVVGRWREYFNELMNVENEREERAGEELAIHAEVENITREEVRKALSKMKNGKAVGPDGIPIEAWKHLGELAVEFLTTQFNNILENEEMPEEWRKSVLVPIYKNKGETLECGNCRGIKLMSHTMKMWERVIDNRLREQVQICEQQYGFMPGKSTNDAVFALKILMEKYREGHKDLHCIFIDLEKAYDRVPREELWYCMRQSGIQEKNVKIVKDMYRDSQTAVRSAVGTSMWFNVEVELHQGSALSPFLFAIVDVRREAPWNMMFADDIVIASESREQAEEDLERWRCALVRRGMKVSRSKTEYLCMSDNVTEETVKLQGADLAKVQDFKYLGCTVQDNGDCQKEVKKRIRAGWNGWRKISGIMCDRKLSAKVKGRIYKVAVRPALMFGLETTALSKRQVADLEVAELKMLRFALGVTRKDKIRNEHIRGTGKVKRLGDKLREARLRWYGHVKRRDAQHVCQRVLRMRLPGKRRRGRPKRRYMDAVKEDMEEVGAVEEDAEDRMRWKRLIRCGDP